MLVEQVDPNLLVRDFTPRTDCQGSIAFRSLVYRNVTTCLSTDYEGRITCRCCGLWSSLDTSLQVDHALECEGWIYSLFIIFFFVERKPLWGFNDAHVAEVFDYLQRRFWHGKLLHLVVSLLPSFLLSRRLAYLGKIQLAGMCAVSITVGGGEPVHEGRLHLSCSRIWVLSDTVH